MTRDTERPPGDGTDRSSRSPDDVLDAAESLLADGGFDRLSVRSIASSIGLSRQVVYTHFDGMDGLLDGLHRRLSRRLGSAVDAVVEEPGSTRHVLAATAAYRRVARRWPELYQLVFEQPVPEHVVGAEARADARRSFARIVDLSRAWLDRRPRDVTASHDDAVELARAVWSATHGFVVVERVGFATVEETDAISDRAIRSMLDGW